jgi:hypothetical protein
MPKHYGSIRDDIDDNIRVLLSCSLIYFGNGTNFGIFWKLANSSRRILILILIRDG